MNPYAEAARIAAETTPEESQALQREYLERLDNPPQRELLKEAE